MITIYDFPLSGHAHKVRLAASLMGVPHRIEHVDLLTNKHKESAYLELNPFGQVPVVTDGGVVVRDSNAILLYLAEMYDTSNKFLPKDPAARAHVYEWLETAAGPIYRGLNLARLIKVFGSPADPETVQRVSKELLAVMEKHLDGKDWLVGDGATLADIACYSYIAVAPEGDVSLEPYPNIRAWLANVEGLDNFVEMPAAA